MAVVPDIAGGERASQPFAALGEGPSRAPAAWVSALVSRARDALPRLSLPTTGEEAWRFTDLSGLARESWRPVVSPGVVDAAAVDALLIDEARASRLVFIDGVYSPGFSDTRGIGDGLGVAPLAQALRADESGVRAQLGRLVGGDVDLFSALNTAALGEAAVVNVARGARGRAPIHLLFIGTDRAPASAVQPRLLLLAGEHSAVTVIEEYVSLGEGRGFTNAVTEAVIGENAELSHIRLQGEGAAAWHVGRVAVELARDARYAGVCIASGARLSRLDLAVRLGAPGARATVDGLALLDGRQHADSHTLLDHASADATSRQLYKSVCDGASHSVFDGRIVVRRDAQRTDSAQQSRGLLLSARAQINAKPQLEIFADDVKAAHGATVGQLDADELFYLQSRGMPAAQARRLLTYAFAAEVVERVPVRSLVQRLRARILERTGLATVETGR